MIGVKDRPAKFGVERFDHMPIQIVDPEITAPLLRISPLTQPDVFTIRQFDRLTAVRKIKHIAVSGGIFKVFITENDIS